MGKIISDMAVPLNLCTLVGSERAVNLEIENQGAVHCQTLGAVVSPL